MTQEALSALRDANVVSQTLTFEQLEAYHVPFDQLIGEERVESVLRYWSTRRGKVALIGESGAGKSSVLAAVLGAFSEAIPDDLVPTWVPVELASAEVVTDVGPFGRHVIRHILNWAAPEALSEAEREGLQRQLADLERRSGRRRRGGFSLGTGMLLPVDVNLQGDLQGAARDFEQQLQNGDVLLAFKRLIAMFRARGLEPFLVFDDTDAWLQLPGQEEAAHALATGFFSSNVRMLTRELDCGFAIAVHRSYLELPAYRQVADSLEPVELPVLEDPASAIETILQRRVDVDELGVGVGDAFDPEALAALAGVYADAPDLRKVMAIAGLAVRKAHDDSEATSVTEQAVIAARAERETMRGIS
jgi:hypothetical protein